MGGCSLAVCPCSRENEIGKWVEEAMFNNQLFPLTVTNDIILDESE